MRSPRPRRRASLLTAALTICLLGACAGTASANTALFVNGATGSDAGGNTCQVTPCKTIQYAIVQGRSVFDSVTVNVAAGAYAENLTLTSADGGLRIAGAGSGSNPASATVITGANSGSVLATTTASSLGLSRLRLVALPGSSFPVLLGATTDFGLDDVVIDNQGQGPAVVTSAGDVTATGGSVTNAASLGSGDGINASGGSITLTGVPLDIRGTGNGVYAAGRVTVTGAPITLSNPSNPNYAVYAGKGAGLTDVVVEQRGTGYGVYASTGSASLSGGSVTLTNSTSGGYAVYASSGSVTLTNSPIATAGTGYGVYASSGRVQITGASVRLTNTSGFGYAIYAGSTAVLNGVEVLSAGSGYGVYSSSGQTDVTGGSITLSNPTTGSYAVYASNGVVTLRSTPVVYAGTGSAVYSGSGGADVSGSAITFSNTAVSGPGLMAGSGDVTLTDSSVAYPGLGNAIMTPGGSLTLRRTTVTHGNGTTTSPAVFAGGGLIVIDASAITSSGKGPALEAFGSAEITGSTLSAGAPGPVGPALRLSEGTGRSAVIRRSVVRQTATGQPSIGGQNVNLTLDSSEALGGTGVILTASGGQARNLVVAGSTLDAGAPGVRDGGAATLSVGADNVAGTLMRSIVQGSILVEAPAATRTGVNGTAAVGCTTTEVPSTTQAATPALGTIACAAGTAGNTSTASLSAIFQSPGAGFELNPSWTGVDSVPAGAISLPAGLTPATKDVAGSPRALNASGTCTPGIQDKGAVELTGHGGNCAPAGPAAAPPPAAGPAAKARITQLKLRPATFAAAAKGASIAKVKAKAKATGTTVSYRNSAAVTTTFTVQRAQAGRLKGKTCAKPAPSNRSGKRCTRYSTVGAFTHKDKAGANSFKFTGRVRGRALAAGAYRLSAVPGTGAARGRAVTAAFTIVR